MRFESRYREVPIMILLIMITSLLLKLGLLLMTKVTKDGDERDNGLKKTKKETSNLSSNSIWGVYQISHLHLSTYKIIEVLK